MVQLQKFDSLISLLSYFKTEQTYKTHLEKVRWDGKLTCPFGRIFIVEKSSRWEGKENELKAKVEGLGFQCFDAMRNTGKFIYLNGEKM